MSVEWTITGVKTSNTPQANTVVHVEYQAKLGDVVRSGSAPMDPPGEDFTPFAELTQQQVLDWLWTKVSKDATEDAINEAAGVSTVASDDLPWA